MARVENEKMLALTVAAKCADAYSAADWGPVLWVSAAEMLLGMGFDAGGNGDG